MPKNIIKFLIKISTISVLLVIFFNIWIAFFDSNTTQTSIKTDNKYKYIKSDSIILSWAWVAISTNLWIRYKETKELPATIYKDVMSIWEIMLNKKNAEKNIITNNMLEIKAYLNIMKTNIKSLIQNSRDKSSTLKAFISQAEYRYKASIKSIKNLTTQRGVLELSMKSSSDKINNLKSKIDRDYSWFKTTETLANIAQYVKLKWEFNYSKIYIVFINQLINQYTYLNSYNKILLDTLINNKEAIIKDAYIVIPDSGTQLLKSLNLIYSEANFKGK